MSLSGEHEISTNDPTVVRARCAGAVCARLWDFGVITSAEQQVACMNDTCPKFAALDIPLRSEEIARGLSLGELVGAVGNIAVWDNPDTLATSCLAFPDGLPSNLNELA